jgi:nitrogen regulatory protein P-II 1
MRAIKAYIRKIKVADVVHALKEIGVSDMTILDVMDVGGETDTRDLRVSAELGEEYNTVAKLEIVCQKEDTAKIVEALKEAAYTGRPGDGIIYVMPVETAIKIRTGRPGC